MESKQKTRKIMNLELPGCDIAVIIKFGDIAPVRVYRISGGGRYGKREQVAKCESIVDALAFVYQYVRTGGYKN